MRLTQVLLGSGAVITLLASCSSRPAPASKVATPAQANGGTSAESAPSIVGDTFVLVTVGSRSTKVPVSDSAACGYRPYMRIVIADQEKFYQVTDEKRWCDGPLTDSASRYSGLWSSYHLQGDTLFMSQGDGNETFDWLAGILSADSLIELDGEWRRFARLRPRERAKTR